MIGFILNLVLKACLDWIEVVFFFKAANHKPGNTIETNLKNLNVNQFDLAFEVSG